MIAKLLGLGHGGLWYNPAVKNAVAARLFENNAKEHFFQECNKII